MKSSGNPPSTHWLLHQIVDGLTGPCPVSPGAGRGSRCLPTRSTGLRGCVLGFGIAEPAVDAHRSTQILDPGRARRTPPDPGLADNATRNQPRGVLGLVSTGSPVDSVTREASQSVARARMSGPTPAAFSAKIASTVPGRSGYVWSSNSYVR